MPIYEYKCRTCAKEFELRRGFSDDVDAVCPKCQGQAERLFSAVPILFKGPGFYVTDYKAKPCDGVSSEKAEEKATREEGVAVAG